MTAAETLARARQAHQAGDLRLAEQLYRQSLEANPADGQAWYLLGAACESQGRLDEAGPALREAVRLLPGHAHSRNQLGLTLVRQGKRAEAEPFFQEAVRLKPDFAVAHKNLGLIWTFQGKLDRATASFRLALFWAPELSEAHYFLGIALRELGKLDEAAASFRQALRLQPDSARAHNDLGLVLFRQGLLEESIAVYRMAVRLSPNEAGFHANLAAALTERGKTEEAEACCREAIRLKPDYANSHAGRGVALAEWGRTAEAEIEYNEALRLDPNLADAHWDRALLWLKAGDYERGWTELEWRWRREGWTLPAFVQPMWDGSPLEGRTILLWAEQGLGDTLQFVRYAPLVQARGGVVVLECQPALVRLLADCPGVDRVLPRGTPLPPFDVHIPLMSLPWVFGTTLATVPCNIPYLRANLVRVQRWLQELATPEFTIGVAWQGSQGFRRDHQRSTSLASFAPLADIPGVKLVSLQKGAGVEQLSEAPFPVIDLGGRLDEAGAFLDTAAVMECLDLVVAVDTSIIHLAGALGRPFWAALHFSHDWRWLSDRDDSPWYPTGRLFRQAAPGDWDGVFREMADELRRRLFSNG
jgi:Flp pilus assembly protein TadD